MIVLTRKIHIEFALKCFHVMLNIFGKCDTKLLPIIRARFRSLNQIGSIVAVGIFYQCNAEQLSAETLVTPRIAEREDRPNACVAN